MPASRLDIILQAYDRMTAPVNNAFNKAQKSLGAFAQKANNVAENSFKTGQQLVTSGFAMAAPLYKAFDAAAEFETKMVDIGKQLQSGDPREYASKLAAMSKQVLSLGHELPIATSEIQDMIAAGLRMGVAEKDVIGFTKEVTKMSVAFDMPAGEIADSMGKIANVFKIPIDKVGDFADAINYLDDNTMAKGPELIDVLQRIGGSAKALKANDAAALASTMLSLGESAETSGSGINAMLNRLGAATMQSKRFQEGMQMLGLSSADIQRKMASQSTAKSAIITVFEEINKLKPEKQTEALVRLFGAEHGPKLAKLTNNMKEFKRQMELVQGAEKGSMNKEYQKRIETSAAQMQIFKNRINELWVKVGSALLPTVNKMIVKLGGWIDKVGKFIEKNPTLVASIVKAAAAFSALSLAGGYLSFIVGGVSKSFGLLAGGGKGLFKVIGFLTDKKKGLTHWVFVLRYRMLEFSQFVTGKLLPAVIKFGRFLSSNLVKALRLVGQGAMWLGRVLMANPIILIITAIAVAAFLIYKYWDKLKPFFTKIWDGIKKVFWAVIDWFKKWGLLLLGPIGWVVALIIKFWKPISDLIAAIFRLVVAIVGLAFRILKWLFLNLTPLGWVIKYWKPIVAFMKWLWGVIVGFLKGVWDGIKSIFRVAGKLVFEYAIAPLIKVQNWINQQWAKVVGIFRSIWNRVKPEFIKAGKWIYDHTIGRLIRLKDALFNAGRNIIKAIGDGIRAGLKWLTDAVDSATQAIRDFFPYSPAKTGPLKDIHRVKLVETVAQGINPNNNALLNKTKKVMQATRLAYTEIGQPAGLKTAAGGSSGNFNVTINLHGGATQDDAKRIATEVQKQLKQYKSRQARVGFA